METLSYLQLAATEIECTFQKYGLSYSQTRYVVQQARQALGLKPKRGRTGTVKRLSAEEAELFIDTAYRVGGQRGLMLKLLLETGARVSEFVQLPKKRESRQQTTGLVI